MPAPALPVDGAMLLGLPLHVARGRAAPHAGWREGVSDLAPHHLEPEGQSAILAGALSPDRSAGGVCGAMRSRSSCGVPHGER